MIKRTVTTWVTARRDLTRANGTTLLYWPGIVAAAAIAVGVAFVATSFWTAMAFNSDVSWFAQNLAWLDATTAVVALAVGGLLAGWLGHPGTFAGVVNGLTSWGLLVAAPVVLGVGSTMPFSSLTNAGTDVARVAPFSSWPQFVAYGLGLLVAVGGGMSGGVLGANPAADPTLGADILDLRNEALEIERMAHEMPGPEAPAAGRT